MSDRLSLSLYRSPTQPLFSSHKNITVRLNSTKYGALVNLTRYCPRHERPHQPKKYGTSVTQDLKSFFFVV